MYLQINILSMTKKGLKEIKSSLSHYVYKTNSTDMFFNNQKRLDIFSNDLSGKNKFPYIGLQNWLNNNSLVNI